MTLTPRARRALCPLLAVVALAVAPAAVHAQAGGYQVLPGGCGTGAQGSGAAVRPATQNTTGQVCTSDAGSVTATQGTSPWVDNISQWGGTNVLNGGTAGSVSVGGQVADGGSATGVKPALVGAYNPAGSAIVSLVTCGASDRSLCVGIDQAVPGTTNAVEEAGATFSNITTGTTTTVKSGAGILHTITLNTQVASATITIYNNTAASGTKIGTITLPSVITSGDPVTLTYNLAFSTGLTIVTSGATDLTVVYR